MVVAFSDDEMETLVVETGRGHRVAAPPLGLSVLNEPFDEYSPRDETHPPPHERVSLRR